MVDAISIALSGLQAQGKKITAVANNVANMTTTGVIPTADNPVSTVYKPMTVNTTALTAAGEPAGVASTISQTENYTAMSDPSSPFANAEGLVAAPNVDLAKEMVDALQAKIAYKANVSVIKTAEEMQDELLNTIA